MNIHAEIKFKTNAGLVTIEINNGLIIRAGGMRTDVSPDTPCQSFIRNVQYLNRDVSTEDAHEIYQRIENLL